jgi:hypothetical protein
VPVRRPQGEAGRGKLVRSCMEVGGLSRKPRKEQARIAGLGTTRKGSRCLRWSISGADNGQFVDSVCERRFGSQQQAESQFWLGVATGHANSWRRPSAKRRWRGRRIHSRPDVGTGKCCDRKSVGRCRVLNSRERAVGRWRDSGSRCTPSSRDAGGGCGKLTS